MIEYLTSTPLGTLSERHALEDAFLLRLAGLTVECGGFLRHLGPFNNDDGAAMEQDFYQQIAQRAPAILVSTGNATSRHMSLRGTDDEDDISVELLVVSSHWRDPVDRIRTRTNLEHEPTADPGVYHMMRAARRLLMGRPLGIAGAKIPMHVSETPLVQERGCCAWRITYRVPVRISQDLAEVERDEWRDLQLAGILVSPP